MPRKIQMFCQATAIIALVAVTGCGRSADVATENDASAIEFLNVTPAGTKEHGPITWGVYRDVQTLDPIFSFDYPDHTAISLFCEGVLHQEPDSTLVAGLAALSRPDDLTLVLDIDPEATFWDGTPVTADDVAYSLERHRDPELAGFYSATFALVDAIEATTDRQVTITFTEPDFWFDTALASRPGTVIQRAYAEQQGSAYGTPEGGVMCTGAYRLKSWVPSTGVVAESNPNYWKGDPPKVSEITLKGLADEAAMTSSLLTGEIAGTYPQAMSTLNELRNSDAVNVYQGLAQHTDALVISNLNGPLGDVRVRQALSLALDRQGLIDTAYRGAANLPRWMANDGTFSYAQEIFENAYQQAPTVEQDLDRARELIAEAGAEGQTITIGMSNPIAITASGAAAYQAAGQAIGLQVELEAVSPDNFINFFTDPAARANVDAFPTMGFGDAVDPLGFAQSIALPDAGQNFSGFDDPELTQLLETSRATADPQQRAEVSIKALERFNEVLPWIPTVQPSNVLILNSELSGAVVSFSYIWSPWVNQLGGK